jgi:hypothetical protein
MTKVRVVVFLAVVALLLFPAMAIAQGPQLPCRFHGTVQIDGANVADDTVITATISGDTYTAKTPSPYGASTYWLEIAPPEGTNYAEGTSVTFMIGTSAAAQTATWEAGGNKELNFSIGEPPVTPPPGGGITSVVVNSLPAGSSATSSYNADTGVLTLGIPKGDAGAAGAAGAQGSQGEEGPGAPGGIALPVIALVIAIIAIGVAVMGIRRRV